MMKVTNPMDSAHWFSQETWEWWAWKAQVFIWLCALLGTLTGIFVYFANSNIATLKKERTDTETTIRQARALNRMPTKEDAEALVAKFKPFSGTRFWIVTDTNDYDKSSEQALFSKNLMAVLEAAGWIKLQELGPKGGPLPIWRPVTSRGVSVGFHGGAQADLGPIDIHLLQIIAAARWIKPAKWEHRLS